MITMVGGSESGDDSDYDRTVENVISQAMDHCVLEQLSALNNVHCSDSDLPPDLDARFRKLKTFPQTKTKIPSPVIHPVPSPPLILQQQQPEEAAIAAAAAAATAAADTSKNNKPFSSPGEGQSEPESQNRRRGSDYSSSISSSPRTPSPPPPPRSGCFCFSHLPSTMMKKKKRVPRKDDDDGIKKILDMARREEAKITREAEQILKLAKQASARIMIDVSPPSMLDGISISDSDDE